MLGFAIEFSLVVALFVWLYHRQERERERAGRIRPSQLPLFDEDDAQR